MVKCKYIKTERKQKWKNRGEAWKGTCSQPARNKDPRTGPSSQNKKSKLTTELKLKEKQQAT